MNREQAVNNMISNIKELMSIGMDGDIQRHFGLVPCFKICFIIYDDPRFASYYLDKIYDSFNTGKFQNISNNRSSLELYHYGIVIEVINRKELILGKNVYGAIINRFYLSDNDKFEEVYNFIYRRIKSRYFPKCMPENQVKVFYCDQVTEDKYVFSKPEIQESTNDLIESMIKELQKISESLSCLVSDFDERYKEIKKKELVNKNNRYCNTVREIAESSVISKDALDKLIENCLKSFELRKEINKIDVQELLKNNQIS